MGHYRMTTGPPERTRSSPENIGWVYRGQNGEQDDAHPLSANSAVGF
jgi:hypothetical protein